jgi:vacuolar-type H+-ATPase subunit I/STV1
MAKPRQSLTRVLGYQPITISAGVKRAIWSVILAFPCALIATAFRYVFSPGTMLAIRVVPAEPSHRGLGVFIDALDWYGRTMSFAFMVNAILYGLFIFGIVTTISGLRPKNVER